MEEADGAELRRLLRRSVDTLKAAQPPTTPPLSQPYLASFAAVALEQRRPPLEDTCATTLRAILRRHAPDIVVRGRVLASAHQVQIQAIGFLSGRYQASTLNVAAVPFNPLDVSRQESIPPHSILTFSVRIDTPTQDVEVIPMNTALPSPTFWDALQDWAPGCSFGGFTFPSSPPSRFSPDPAPSINHLLKRDLTATNLYAVDGMLFTYSAPSVTSYIVRPKLHQDEALSYRALSKQQMQQWAADKRSQAASLRHKGKREEAIAAYATAIEMDHEDAENFVGRAGLFLELKRMDEARRDIEAALALQPAHAAALELQRKLHAAAVTAAVVDVAPRQALVPEGKDPDRLRALLELDIKRASKDKKKDHKKEHKKKEKKKHKKRSRSRSSERSARKKR